MRFLFLTLFLSISVISFGQNQQPDYNLELKSTRFYPEGLSGIWNYVAPDGHEFAVVGTQIATSIIDLKDPENPVEIANFPGSNNIWREARYWGTFIYVTTESNDGLLIINMVDPYAATSSFWKPLLNVNGTDVQYETCHSINMDEKGIMALNGTNINGGTALLFDVNTTPGTPIYLGTPSPSQYTHDSYMQNNILYTFDILNGVYRVFNAKNPADPKLLAVQETSFAFTHNGWTSDDGHYLFTTDERANAYVDAYDISDLTDIKKLDVFRSVATEGTGVIPHNTYWRDGYLITSYYTDGVKIIDAHKPDNLIEVGSYDTYKGADGGFHGAWGVCPFFPSGLIVVSDIENGLFVFQPSYIRACYLEGKVTDTDGNLLPQVDVKIISPIFNKSETDAQGEYRTGIADAGNYMVTYSKDGYYPQTLPVVLENGQVTIQDVVLQQIAILNFNGLATIKTIGGGVPEAQIALSGEYGEFYATANQEGIFTFSLYPGKYHLIAGAWGYLYNVIDSIQFDAENTSFTIELEKGYQDDFVFDFLWTVTGTAETGLWERGSPEGTGDNGTLYNPAADVDTDLGNKCYVTGVAGGGIGDNDVDNGTAILTSPIFDLSNYIAPHIQYRTWFANGGGNSNPNDTLSVFITNGTETVLIEKIINPKGVWRAANNLEVSTLIEPTESMQLIFSTTDLASSGHVLEAGVDEFLVTGDFISKTNNTVAFNKFITNPNPFTNSILISAEGLEGSQYTVSNVFGQILESGNCAANASQMELGKTWVPGVYFIKLTDNKAGKMSTMQLIKQ